MFLSAKKKAERELEIQREKWKNLTEAVAKMMDYNAEAMDTMEELEGQQRNVDQAFLQAVRSVKLIRAGEEEKSAQENSVMEKMSQLTVDLEQQQERSNELREHLAGRRKELLQVAEQNEQCQGPTGILHQSARNMELCVEQMGEVLGQMEELGHQMGIRSLEAAIEAGRMGEPGLQFVSAAGEVQTLAESYQAAVENLRIQAEGLEQQLKESREQVEMLTGRLEENNIHIGNVTVAFQEHVAEIEAAGIGSSDLAAESRSLLEDMKKAAAVTGANGNHFVQALHSMEAAGESFLQGQRAAEQVKEQLKQVQTEAGQVR